ncbi:histidine kinase [Streptomyces sp. L7]
MVEERLRLARELHDIVAHSITVINFQAGAAAHLLRREPDAAEAAIEHVITASGSTLAELGTMLTVLRRPDGETPLPEPTPTLDRLDDLLDGFPRRRPGGRHTARRQDLRSESGRQHGRLPHRPGVADERVQVRNSPDRHGPSVLRRTPAPGLRGQPRDPHRGSAAVLLGHRPWPAGSA